MAWLAGNPANGFTVAGKLRDAFSDWQSHYTATPAVLLVFEVYIDGSPGTLRIGFGARLIAIEHVR